MTLRFGDRHEPSMSCGALQCPPMSFNVLQCPSMLFNVIPRLSMSFRRARHGVSMIWAARGGISPCTASFKRRWKSRTGSFGWRGGISPCTASFKHRPRLRQTGNGIWPLRSLFSQRTAYFLNSAIFACIHSHNRPTPSSGPTCGSQPKCALARLMSLT